MSDKDAYYKKLLTRYLDNSIAPEELNPLFAMTQTGKYDHILRQTVALFQAANADAEAWHAAEREKIFEQVKKKIQQAGSFHKQQGPRRFVRWWALPAAATLAGLLGLAMYFAGFSPANIKTDEGVYGHWTTYSNVTDSNVVVALTDGSKVELWPGAVIRFGIDTLRHLRQLQLQGSAGFDVAHVGGWSFKVEGHGVTVSVLGTRFTVVDDHQAATVDVTVQRGKVQVSAAAEAGNKPDKQESMILVANHKAAFNRHTGTLTHTLADEIMPMTAQGQAPGALPSLDFRKGAAIGNIMQALEEVYGVSISVQDAVLIDCTMTGDFSGKELHDILDIICLSVNAVYAIRGDSVVITGKGCN